MKNSKTISQQLNYPLHNPASESDACGVAFIADIKGIPSHNIISDSLTALENLQHRGASGSEKNTGDGAGIIFQIPHEFFVSETKKSGMTLPDKGFYGVGTVFLPKKLKIRLKYETIIEEIVKKSGQLFLGWRKVRQNNQMIGRAARLSEPKILQFFIQKNPVIKDGDEFERALYLIRRRIEKKAPVYISSLSSRTIVYKGMLSADQIRTYFPDLVNPLVKSAIALVHQRFSTNTFPSWSLAHPFRYLAHNGEINTLRGNKSSMRAREHLFRSKIFGKNIKDLLPVIQSGGSDSSNLDNTLELLVMSGRSLPHAMMMLIPEPWSNHTLMDDTKKAFYNYHSSLMEPWDGPALISFTDGIRIGAILDRNGLRPARYYVTKDDRLIMASEVGVVKVADENILHKGRLQPGKMLLVDTQLGKIIPDEELKNQIAEEKPYAEWLEKNRVKLKDLTPPLLVPRSLSEEGLKRNGGISTSELIIKQLTFGFTEEEKRMIMTPMASNGEEPLGSMGNDTPVAVLSDRSQLLFNYFKQMFAQVTNPPLDAIREELVTSMSVLLGSEGNLLEPGPSNCRQIELPFPVLTNAQLESIRKYKKPGFKTKSLHILFRAKEKDTGLKKALEDLFRQASIAIERGYTILHLTDKGVNNDLAPIPSLLAVSALHHYLVKKGTRTKVSIIISTGEAREVHHFCCLLGFGASAVNPYLAFDVIEDLVTTGMLPVDKTTTMKNYIKAVNKGIMKVMSKMGISTLDSYRGAQIFEAVGLKPSFVEKYFTYTSSRIGGIGLAGITRELLERHSKAFQFNKALPQTLDTGGEYKWRRNGSRHFYTPEIIEKLQHASRTGDYTVFKEYTRLVDDLNGGVSSIRGLLSFKSPRKKIPLSEVEPVESVVKRFASGAMSYGSISQEAHVAIAIAMNRLGAKSNSGEGGEDPARFKIDANGENKNSAIKQVASARFGVTSEYLASAKDLQIKMAQGAKPGEGGHLPGSKVYSWIAKVRHATAGVGLISPPPHHDIYSIEDLAQLIYDLKNSNPQARIGVKLVAEVGVGTIAAGVAKAHADTVLISGHDGGTGAAPLSSIKHTGIPWEIGLAETQQVLLKNGLRGRITVQVDGHLKSGRDVIIAALLGAEEFGFATSALVTVGCVMMRVCHLDTCPVGIATQNPELRKKFAGKPEYVENFFLFLAREVREYMAELGFRTMDEMIGRAAGILDFKPALSHWKAKGIDLSALLSIPDLPGVPPRCVEKQEHGLENALDHKLIKFAKPVLMDKKRGVGAGLVPAQTKKTLKIKNRDRTVGTMLGYEITKRFGSQGLSEDTIQFTFHGSAGQSFGAFIPKGLTLILEGDANDHVGKGLSGGTIIVASPKIHGFVPEENIAIGNVALYGATAGVAFINGIAGERFAVRNSGATAVVEGVGDHGCEYMTKGVVVVLGSTGRNFAAGMSGGMAFVLNEKRDFYKYCNLGMVNMEELSKSDKELIYTLIKQHLVYTGSPLAKKILADWKKYSHLFTKVMPREYKKILEEKKEKLINNQFTPDITLSSRPNPA